MCNFHPLEVVGRGSETQLQVGENFFELTLQDKGLNFKLQCPILYIAQRIYEWKTIV